MNRKWLRIRDFFRMQAHWGWLHAALGRLRRPQTSVLRLAVPLIDAIHRRMDAHTQKCSRQFDEKYSTQTYGRMDVPVSADRINATLWGYQAINQDFFREIMGSIPVPLDSFTFIDIGSGKGAAVLMAGEFPFSRLVGVELNAELVEDARLNETRFNERSDHKVAPEWAVGDFFQWTPPDHPCLFFFNNPFPSDLTLLALERLDALLANHAHRHLLVFRKPPNKAGDYLNRSRFWKPLRLAPYWRVYISQVSH